MSAVAVDRSPEEVAENASNGGIDDVADKRRAMRAQVTSVIHQGEQAGTAYIELTQGQRIGQRPKARESAHAHAGDVIRFTDQCIAILIRRPLPGGVMAIVYLT